MVRGCNIWQKKSHDKEKNNEEQTMCKIGDIILIEKCKSENKIVKFLQMSVEQVNEIANQKK